MLQIKQGEMKAHSLTHKEDMPYACELCDYRATHKGHVTRHMAIHTAERQVGESTTAFAL